VSGVSWIFVDMSVDEPWIAYPPNNPRKETEKPRKSSARLHLQFVTVASRFS
jgi:hypothetical protein